MESVYIRTCNEMRITICIICDRDLFVNERSIDRSLQFN